MTDPTYQLSEKYSNGGIFVIRGNDYSEFSTNIEKALEDPNLGATLSKLTAHITGGISAATGAANVQQAFPTAQPVAPAPQPGVNPQGYSYDGPPPWEQVAPMAQQAPQVQYQQAPPAAGAVGRVGEHMCSHGAKVFKEGTAKATGKAWYGWFCPQYAKGPGCDVEWSR